MNTRERVDIGALAQTVSHAILDSDPDLGRVCGEIASEAGLEEAVVERLIRGTVRDLNGRFFPPIVNLELIHTEGCNLACSYCFEREMLGYRRMSAEVARAAIDLLFDYSGDERDLTIVHFGGEPLMNFPAVVSSTEYASAKASRCGKTVKFEMTSNGTLLDHDKARFCARHGINVLLSIDGLPATNDRYRVDKRGRGTFTRALAGLHVLREHQPWIGVKMTVMPVNAERLFEDVLGLRDLGVNQFIIGHATGVAWSDEEVETYGAQLRAVFDWYQANRANDLRIADFDDGEVEVGFFGCQAGRTSIAASVDGQISPCSKILGLGTKRILAKLGDVRFGLTHLVNRGEIAGAKRIRSACSALSIADEYQGGCFASNFSDNGDLFSPSLQDHRFSVINRSICSGCASANPH